MNREEAARIITFIGAPYGGEPLAVDAIEAWFMSALERCDFAVGMEIAQLLISVEPFRPTPAVFNRAIRERRQHAALVGASERKALPAAASDDAEKVKKIIEDLRAKLAANGAHKNRRRKPHAVPQNGTTP